MKNKIILASSSPFRKKLLEQTGLTFEPMPPNYKEDISISQSPEDVVKTLSEGKASNVAKSINENAVIIGSDQVFVFEGKIYGKAKDISEAKKRLKMLSGGHHRLVTGLCVINTESKVTKTISDTVKIYMRNLNDSEIDNYLSTGEWKGVAGSYRIEGKGVALIEKIEGDYFSVIGLPIFKLLTMLREMNVAII